ncbi:MAG: acyl-CoA dehydrogenase family protein, partial [Elusimicrobiota bacterium]
GRGFSMAMKVLEAGRAAISGISLGMARSVLEEAIKHCRNKPVSRRYKGSPGLSADQKVIAEYASRLHAIRRLALHAAELCDAGKRFAIYASMAKLLSGELATKSATEMLDVIGLDAIGDHQVAKQFKDAKLYQIGEGTSEIQAMIISRLLYGNPDLLDDTDF